MKRTTALFIINMIWLCLPLFAQGAPNELVARCVGGVQSPKVILEWKYIPHIMAYKLEKGDSFPTDPEQFWGPVSTMSNHYLDSAVQYGKTYTYRVQHENGQYSNATQVTVNEAYCGNGPVASSDITARCTGGVNNPVVTVEWFTGTGGSGPGTDPDGPGTGGGGPGNADGSTGGGGDSTDGPGTGGADGTGSFYSLQKGYQDTQNQNGFWHFLNYDQNFSSYSDTDVVKGQTYSYRLKYSPGSTSQVVQVPITKAYCGRPVLPYYTLTAKCVGGNDPRIVLEWGTTDSTLQATENLLQRGGGNAEGDSPYWGFLQNEEKKFSYTDTDIYFGETYNYRVKYNPNTVSNNIQVAVTPYECGVR